MISVVRTLGAPVIDAAGKSASNSVFRSASESATTVDVMVCRVG